MKTKTIAFERWYWLKEDFESLGDAYDDVVEKLLYRISKKTLTS